jgi:HEAT repeat protein
MYDQDFDKERQAASRTELAPLLAALESRNGRERQQARQKLIDMGHPAVPPLLEILEKSRLQQARWEAAKALSEIADPLAGPALVRALEDRQFDIRWLAAKGLIAIGPTALPPLLQALEHKANLVVLREGAHHVLSNLAKQGYEAQTIPVLQALDGIEPSAHVPGVARSVLDEMSSTNRKRFWYEP